MIKYKIRQLPVINGNILIGLDYEEFLNFHKKGDNDIAVGARECKVQFLYGVIETEGLIINKIEEKPKFDFFVNSEIYVLRKILYLSYRW